MKFVVLKFGGSSLATSQSRDAATEHVIALKRQGYKPVVVVSACGNETDSLMKQTNRSHLDARSARELATILASAEQKSAGLFALLLLDKQISSRSYCAWQLPIVTEGGYLNATIKQIKIDLLIDAVAQGYVPIVAGFQGVNSLGDETTTLGRGGSDLTAVALAAALGCTECQIFTDVDGVYNFDPRRNHQAKLIASLSYEQMSSLAKNGAQVLQQASIDYAEKHNITIHIRSTFTNRAGSIVSRNHSRSPDEIINYATC